MSRKAIKTTHSIAKEKIDKQYDIAAQLVKSGIDTIKKNRNTSRSEVDNYRMRYEQWRGITIEVLNEIFVSTDYSYKFRTQKSSETKLVSSSWQPDIEYYIRKEIKPKIDYLKILSDDVPMFDEVKIEDINNSKEQNTSAPAQSGGDMSLKSIIENSPALIVIGCLFTGFMSGVGAMEYLDGREKALREEVLAQVREENRLLRESNENLDSTVKDLVVKHINQQAIIEGKPLGGNNSEVRKAVEGIDSGEIAKIIRDPTKDIKRALGF